MTREHPRLTVAALMTGEVISCHRDASLAAVAETLARRRIHGLFVRDDDGQPLGVVSDFDLLAGEWMSREDDGFQAMQQMTAADLMSSPVATIPADAAASTAAEWMIELRVSRLLVLDDRAAPVGVLAVSDLVAPLGRASSERNSVRDIMSHAIVTCQTNASVAATARGMTERRSRSVIVLDDDGEAVGVITGTDLLRLYRSGESPRSVAELMSTPVVIVEPDRSLAEAAELMVEREVHRLVVVDRSRSRSTPLGIVSTADIVGEMAHERSIWQSAPG